MLNLGNINKCFYFTDKNMKNKMIKKVAHNIILSVFVFPEENEKQIENKFLELVPFDLKKEKIFLERTKSIGSDNKKIIIYKIKLEKIKHTYNFLENLFSKFSDEQKKLIEKDIEDYINNDVYFILKFDKKKLLENELWLTKAGDVFYLKMKIACYPKNKSNAINVMRKFINDFSSRTNTKLKAI